MSINFKHEDTRLLVATVALFLLLAAVLWVWLGLASLVLDLALVLAALMALQLHLHRTRQDDDVRHLAHVQALHGLYAHQSFRAPVPPLTRWAAAPEFVATLTSLIQRRRPRTVVELGSGASTVVMSYALADLEPPGRLIALDHDADYAEATRRQLAWHDVDAVAEVRHAPLVPHDLDGDRHLWYDLDALADDVQIDLLVIDGPPHDTQRMVRYPALPLLYERLAPDAVVALDDADRDDETEAVRRWQAAYPDLDVERLPSPRGLAMLQRRPT